MAKNERKCPDCGGVRFVEDHAQGDIVCAGCGLVVEAHIIDERSEWRTFSDKDKESTDPNRVGGPNNPLLEGGGLTTVIARGQGDGSSNLNRLHMRNNNPDKALQAAFSKLGDLAEKLRLTNPTIKNTACELYKRGTESHKLRGRSTDAICAACIYLACRQSNTPRLFKEITAVMPASVLKKDISACFKLLQALMKEVGQNRTEDLAPVAQHPADYMKRFCAELKLGHDMLRLLQDFAYAAKPKEESETAVQHGWDARSPVSIAAAILFIFTQIKDPVPMATIVAVTDVAEVTIRATYRDLYPFLNELLPPEYRTAECIARLPRVDVSRLKVPGARQ